jgi:hypothetical protein
MPIHTYCMPLFAALERSFTSNKHKKKRNRVQIMNPLALFHRTVPLPHPTATKASVLLSIQNAAKKNKKILLQFSKIIQASANTINSGDSLPVRDY